MAVVDLGSTAVRFLLARINPNSGCRLLVQEREPTLSALVARLLGAAHGERLAFKKGGAALVDLPDGPAGGGVLLWFLKPKVLRALASD